MKRWADVSACGLYRWRLSRTFDETSGRTGLPITFVMLNPSTADGEVDDRTIRRCIGFAERERAPELRVVNLFAWRATKPIGLLNMPEERTRPEEQAAWDWGFQGDALMVVAWGALNGPRDLRARILARRKTFMGFTRVVHSRRELFALGVNQEGTPRHPLYVPVETPLTPWRGFEW